MLSFLGKEERKNATIELSDPTIHESMKKSRKGGDIIWQDL